MLKLTNCEVHVVSKGEGSPVLFLHGNPDSSRLWDPVIEVVSRTHRCVAPDLPGFGQSIAHEGFDYSLTSLARFVAELISELGLSQPLTVVGHDFGGFVACAFAARHPRAIRSLVLSNTSFHSSYRWHMWAHIWRTPLLGELSMALNNKPMFVQEIRRGAPRLSKEHFRKVYDDYGKKGMRATLKLYRAVRRDSLKGWEDEFQRAAESAPVLVIWGEGDIYVGADQAEQLGARKIVRYAGAGHWAPAVEPARFAEDMMAFMH